MVETILEMRNISKHFPGVQALEDVDFDVRRGEIHALVGQNGAGKSTLLKILAGIHRVDRGEVIIRGENAIGWSPRDVLDHGVSFINQELNLVSDMTVSQNIMLGREPRTRFSILKWEEMNRKAEQALQRIGITDLAVKRSLSRISVAQQQMVAIARALDQFPQLLVLDEPTSRLSHEEVERLFAVLEGMVGQGISIIYVSHRLEEVYRIAGRVTVIRDGHLIGTHDLSEIAPNDLVQEMIGARVRAVSHAEPVSREGRICLEVENVSGFNVHNVSFSVRRGEVLGIVGVVGAGKTELMHVLFGIDPRTSGRVRVDEKEVELVSTKNAISSRIALCPEDRKAQGLLLESPVVDNITLASMKSFCGRGGLISRKREKDHARRMVETLNIAAPSIFHIGRNLSGGNQQKVVLSKWLSTNSTIILLDEPTVGVDVQGKVEIYDLMHSLAAKGSGVIMSTSDPEEAWRVCSRLLVMFKGAIVKELIPQQVTLDRLMFFVMGGKE